MANKFRLFTKRFLLLCNIIVVAVFLVACVVPYIDPSGWWFLSILGIGFPFLLLIVIAFFVWWLIAKRKYALLSGIALLLGIKSISVFFAFNFSAGFTVEKKGDIRIATWNVARFIEMKNNNNKGSQTRLKMFDLLKEQNADILCLQEFIHVDDNPEWYANITDIQKKLNYPYYTYTYYNDGNPNFILKNGTIIFSRFPIVDSGQINFPRPSLREGFVFADIRVKQQTIRVYSTHLQSFQLRQDDYKKISQIKEGEDGIVSNSKSIFAKMKTAIVNRQIQTDLARKIMDDSPHPVMFCGDMNDVPNSYTYFTLRGNMQDAFLEKGKGIGRTFSSLSPTLRIDYILADKSFKVKQFKRVVKNYSDHYLLVADLQLLSKK